MATEDFNSTSSNSDIMPEMPNMPEMSKMPEMPNMPEMPKMPEMPEMPKMPEMPEMPEMPKMPDTSNLSGEMTSFMNSNSLVAKFAFVFLVIIIFIVLLNLVITIISSILYSSSGTPHLLDGMQDARTLLIISQNPNDKNSIPILRSDNQREGITFTWSIWIYLNGVESTDNVYKHIFNKGSGKYENSGLYYPNNAPGLYISPNTNDLEIFMNVYKDPTSEVNTDCEIDSAITDTYNMCAISEQIKINKIPIKKWVNVIIRCEQNVLDCYINGTLTKRHILTGVPVQNYDNVYVCNNGGFDGYVSNLWYYNYALGTKAINDIAVRGPNMKMKDDGMAGSVPKYFSMRWYFNNTNTADIGYGGLS